MDTHTKCMIAEQICEGVIGTSIGIGLRKTMFPHCTTGEKIVVTMGGMIGAWMIGRKFGKMFYKWCDHTFGTEFNEDGQLDENI